MLTWKVKHQRRLLKKVQHFWSSSRHVRLKVNGTTIIVTIKLWSFLATRSFRCPIEPLITNRERFVKFQWKHICYERLWTLHSTERNISNSFVSSFFVPKIDRKIFVSIRIVLFGKLSVRSKHVAIWLYITKKLKMASQRLTFACWHWICRAVLL